MLLCIFQLQDVLDREYIQSLTKAPSKKQEEPRVNDKGFVIKNAPWDTAPDTSSTSEFPSFLEPLVEMQLPPIAIKPGDQVEDTRYINSVTRYIKIVYHYFIMFNFLYCMVKVQSLDFF